MPSSSPTVPGLTSGESSSVSSDTSISSSGTGGAAREEETGIPVGPGETETRTGTGSRNQNGSRRQSQRQSVDRERVPVTVTSTPTSVISGRTGSRSRASIHAEGTAPSRASISSWSTGGPSISSVPSQPATHEDEGGDGDQDAGADAVDTRIYTCLFHMLDCHESFADENNWRTHVLSHFRTHPTPRTARCPLCPNKFVDGHPHPLSSPIPGEKDEKEAAASTEAAAAAAAAADDDLNSRTTIRRVDSGTDVRDDGPYTGLDLDADDEHGNDTSSAWNRLLQHVGGHYRAGQTLAGSRPDFELMRYLYGRRIISDAQFKAMQLAPAPSSPAYHASQDGVRASIGSSDEPYCAPYSRRREERMRGQQKGVSVGVV
ncbi:hypothetical protein N7532_000658 [Penicillium argentinense]|uniref:C2H2-type domain-containing protein n=1 Tax=Penicillium argentinense TaxID=1131581 RepID=A0A9W9G5S5_9EURO|nr:uncharacterized protein N7532_000658 [Penicillium argentinense]KAJ5112613.1 hypothetical protein N7532_000658 [Penicillium argentinense]